MSYVSQGDHVQYDATQAPQEPSQTLPVQATVHHQRDIKAIPSAT